MSKLSVCLIAKDEEKNIERALKSVLSVADEILVVDTGSTDSTVDIAKEQGAKVIRHKWRDDFSEARNFALDQASCEWVLQLDADEELHEADPKHVARLLSQPRIVAYNCQIVNMVNPDNLNGATSHRFHRLFRRRSFRYEGIIHESPEYCGGSHSGQWPWAELHILHWGYMDKEDAPGKNKRNRTLLRKAIERDHGNFMLHFYLGANYASVDRHEEALESFEKAESLDSGGVSSFKALSVLCICESLWWLERLDEARDRAKTGIDRFPDYRDLLYLAGRIFEAQDDMEKAISCYDQAAGIKVMRPGYLLVREGIDGVAAARAEKCRKQMTAQA